MRGWPRPRPLLLRGTIRWRRRRMRRVEVAGYKHSRQWMGLALLVGASLLVRPPLLHLQLLLLLWL